MADAETATDKERAVDALRHDIVRGTLRPGAKLKMRELKAHYQLGASPLREALAQLSAQGLVLQARQRGFSVPPLTIEHLEDITRSRQLIEGEALRLAMEAGGDAWEAEIVSAFHLLEREIARHARERLALGEAYEAIHHRFHRALIAACPLASLKAFSDLLYINASRYRALMLERMRPTPEVTALHRKLMDLVLARRSSAALAEHHRHIAYTARDLMDRLDGPKRRPTPKTKQRPGRKLK
jgi:GntR family transcriptional regulator, carbon starvation induced regulator